MRTILITSAVEKEGKSTTAANLAIAEARAGRRVALVDLDLRVPYIDRFFGLVHAQGVTDVALGNATLENALHTDRSRYRARPRRATPVCPNRTATPAEHGLARRSRRRPTATRSGRVRRQQAARRDPPPAARELRPRDHRHAAPASRRRRDDAVDASRRAPDRHPAQRHPPPDALGAAPPARDRARREARLRRHRLARRPERQLRLRLRLRRLRLLRAEAGRQDDARRNPIRAHRRAATRPSGSESARAGRARHLASRTPRRTAGRTISSEDARQRAHARADPQAALREDAPARLGDQARARGRRRRRPYARLLARAS